MIEIPMDIRKTGNKDLDCYAIFYGETEQEVVDKCVDYIRDYPTEGYGTYLDEGVEEHPGGYFYAKMRRWHSCS